MKNGYKALAVSARKQALEFTDKMNTALDSLDDKERAKAKDFKALALHQANEAKVYDREAARYDI